MVAAAADMEEVVVEDVPPISGLSGFRPSPGFAGFKDCTEYPALLDDIYVCAQDRVYSSPFVIASAGPYLFRRTRDPRRLGLVVAAAIAVSTRFVNDPRLQGTLVHELIHALGL